MLVIIVKLNRMRSSSRLKAEFTQKWKLVASRLTRAIKFSSGMLLVTPPVPFPPQWRRGGKKDTKIIAREGMKRAIFRCCLSNAGTFDSWLSWYNFYNLFYSLGSFRYLSIAYIQLTGLFLGIKVNFRYAHFFLIYNAHKQFINRCFDG